MCIRDRSLAITSDGRLWTVFADRPAGYSNAQIHCAYSDDGGATWTVEQVTDDDTAKHNEPCIAIDSQDNIHIIYYRIVLGQSVVFYMKRTNGSWGSEETVSQVLGKSQSVAVIAIDSLDNVHVVWRGGGEGTFPDNVQIKYRKRTAGGWGSMELVTEINNTQYLPSIAIDSEDNVHVVWYGRGWEGKTQRNIRYRKRTTTWQTPEAITDIATSQFIPQIALDSNDVPHVVWQGIGALWPTGAHAVDYKNRIGGNWSALEIVAEDEDANTQDNPSIAIDKDNNIHVAWTGRGLGLPTDVFNIRYRKKTTSWQPMINITTETAWDSYYSCLLWAMWPEVDGVRTNIPSPNRVSLVWWYWAWDYLKFYSNIPVVTTEPATAIGTTSATPNGTLDNDGGEACNCGFEWGETIAYEHGATPTESKVTGQSFSQVIIGLDPNTTYHFRAFATNSAGTSYGADRTFTTEALPPAVIVPTVTTNPATLISQVSATLNGFLGDDGGEACQCGLQWGLTTAYGHTTLTESRVTGESFSRAIGGLTPGTTYHFRAFATNSAGTGYGADRSFISTPIFSRAHALSREEL